MRSVDDLRRQSHFTRHIAKLALSSVAFYSNSSQRTSFVYTCNDMLMHYCVVWTCVLWKRGFLVQLYCRFFYSSAHLMGLRSVLSLTMSAWYSKHRSMCDYWIVLADAVAMNGGLLKIPPGVRLYRPHADVLAEFVQPLDGKPINLSA